MIHFWKHSLSVTDCAKLFKKNMSQCKIAKNPGFTICSHIVKGLRDSGEISVIKRSKGRGTQSAAASRNLQRCQTSTLRRNAAQFSESHGGKDGNCSVDPVSVMVQGASVRSSVDTSAVRPQARSTLWFVDRHSNIWSVMKRGWGLQTMKEWWQQKLFLLFQCAAASNCDYMNKIWQSLFFPPSLITHM